MEYVLILRWLIAFALLLLAGLPIASLVFPRDPRRGAGLAMALSLLVFVLTGYYVGHVAYGTPALVAAVLGLGAASLLAVRLGGRIHAAAGAEAYLAFLGGFALLLLFRVYDPIFHYAGGEKFLHFGALQAVGHADRLPPEDMWYAGESINYYYGIPVMTDLLSRATVTDHRYAYNVALPAYFGVFVAATYGLAGALTASRGHSFRVGGLLGIVFACLGGFLSTPARLVFGALPRETAVAYGYGVFRGIRHIDYPESVAEQGDPFSWYWFYDRYVVQGALTEFPLFGYVKGDMHGQNVTLAWLVLAAALGLAYYRTPPERRRRRLALAFGAFPVLGGFHGITNTWSLPTVAGIAWLAITFAPAHPATLLPGSVRARVRDLERTDRHEEVVRPLVAAGVAAVVGALSYVLAGPFLFFNTPQNRGVGFLPSRTEAIGAVLLYGAFLALFAVFLLTRGRSPRPRDRTERYAVVGGALAGSVLLVLTDLDTLVLFAPVLVAAWYLLRRDETVGYETVLVVGGVGLILAMELVYARVAPFDVPRWNTTFKVSVQAWTLSALAAAPITATLLAEARADLDRDALAGATDGEAALDRLRPVGTIALVAILLVGTTSFGALAVGHHVDDEVRDAPEWEPTTDGLEPYEHSRPATMEAIYWLESREGTPTMVTMPGRDAYHFQSAPATFTGYPTLVGWTHVENHRSEEAFARRAGAADTVYTGAPREAGAVLHEYGVDYVWYGQNEWEEYGRDHPLDDVEWASVAFRNHRVTIYEIDRPALSRALANAESAEE